MGAAAQTRQCARRGCRGGRQTLGSAGRVEAKKRWTRQHWTSREEDGELRSQIGEEVRRDEEVRRGWQSEEVTEQR